MQALIGLDGSEGGRDALELARVLGGDGAGTLIASVLSSGRLDAAAGLLAAGDAAGAEPLFAQAREVLGGGLETRAYGGCSPARALTEIAEAEAVEMVIVGSPHRGPLGRTLIGSVAESLLQGAPCTVAIAPRGYAHEAHEGPLRKIAVAFDGGPEAKAALKRAESLALASGAAIRILTVEEAMAAMPGVVGYTPPPPRDPQETLEEARAALDPALAIEGESLAGPTARVIAEACAEGTDLLISGSRGYGPISRVLLGSVSTQLAHMAPCPLMVVPRP